MIALCLPDQALHISCEMTIMRETAHYSRETIELIKEAAYDVQIGPAEISPSAEHPGGYVLKFENFRGEAQQMLVRQGSNYELIRDALKLAYEGYAS